MANQELISELSIALKAQLIELQNNNEGKVKRLQQLTETTLTGDGVFDKLMAAGKLHIQEELENDRIVKTDYAQTYLGLMQASMQTAVSFLVAWDKAELDKIALATQSLNNLIQSELVDAQVRLNEAQILLYKQKVITEISEVATSMPAEFTAGGDLANIVPYAPVKIAGAKGANRDVSLEQRAGYMRKAQNDLIKVATGHVDMLVSSGSATNVGDYTRDLLELLQTGGATPSFPVSSLLSIAVTDAATLRPGDADSVD